MTQIDNQNFDKLNTVQLSNINEPPKKKKKKSSKRCKHCKKKKGVYLLKCKCCNKKFCIACLDVVTHCCEFQQEYLQDKKEKLKSDLFSGDSNFLKIDKI